jgi:ApaG protein
MYRALTRNIEVTVTPRFMPEQSKPRARQYFWAYTVEIVNRGADTVRLHARHWRITDGAGREQRVDGLGVVGEQPLLKAGERFEYTSGCPLATPAGIMAGNYEMIGPDGEHFLVEIPAFSLDSPHDVRILN